MPIRTLRKRYPSIGRISCGYMASNDSGTLYPARSKTLVFHSDVQERLDVLAGRYGGTVRVSPASSDGDERYYLHSESTELGVFLPPGDLDEICSQWLEAWASSGLVRRCDGVDCVLWRDTPTGDDKIGELSDQIRPCVCDADDLPDKQRCKPVVRLAVLPECYDEIPGLGIWTVHSGGWGSNEELYNDMRLLFVTVGQRVPTPDGGAPFTMRVVQQRSRHGDVPKLRLDLRSTPGAVRDALAAGATTAGAPELDAGAAALPDTTHPVGTYVDESTGEILDATEVEDAREVTRRPGQPAPDPTRRQAGSEPPDPDAFDHRDGSSRSRASSTSVAEKLSPQQHAAIVQLVGKSKARRTKLDDLLVGHGVGSISSLSADAAGDVIQRLQEQAT